MVTLIYLLLVSCHNNLLNRFCLNKLYVSQQILFKEKISSLFYLNNYYSPYDNTCFEAIYI